MEKYFWLKATVTDIWSTDVKIHSARLLTIVIIYNVIPFLSYWTKTNFLLKMTVNLTCNVLTTNSIGTLTDIPVIITVGNIFLYLNRNRFSIKENCDIDFWTIDPNIKMLYCSSLSKSRFYLEVIVTLTFRVPKQ
jgi:hypothetical protein